MDKVLDMRRAQKAFFDARRRSDHISAQRYLEESKTREREVDQYLQTRGSEIKFGEQKMLFK